MTSEEKLSAVASITGEDDESLLGTYLALAEDAIMQRAYPIQADRASLPFPPRYDGLHVRVAVAMWAKRGAEGEASHNENGVQRTYEDSAKLLSEVLPHASVIGA